MTDDREDKLPAWAKQIIHDLRQRLRTSNEPLVAELAKLRPQVEFLKRRNEALTELLECAALGQHKTAAEIVAILHTYDLTLTPSDPAST